LERKVDVRAERLISSKSRIVRSSRSLGWEVMNRIRDIRGIAEIRRSSSGNGISPSFFP